MNNMEKPKFNPSQSFDVVGQAPAQGGGIKPKFNPNQQFEAVPQQQEDEPGFFSDIGHSALEGVVAAGRFVDTYTGAPTRAAIGAAQNTKNPISAFTSQFGEDPDLAPTGKQLAQKAGVPDTSLSDVIPSLYTEDDKEAEDWFKFKKGGTADITASGAAGLGLDIAADPLNAVGLGPLTKGLKAGAKGVGQTAKTGSKMLGKGVSKIPVVGVTKDILVESAENTAKALGKMFDAKQADDYGDLLKIAEKNGISKDLLPESVEFGADSFVSRAARHRAEGVIGNPHLEKFHEGLSAVRDATEHKIKQIGGGLVPSKVEAGSLIMDGYNQAVDDLFKSVDFTYSQVIKQAPGIRLTDKSLNILDSKLNGLEKFAIGRLKRGITKTDKAQGQQILNAIESVRAGNGSFKQTYEAMADIGRHAFKPGNSMTDIPVDMKKFKDLYHTLRTEFVNSTRAQLGDDIANDLIKNNERITDFMGKKGAVSRILGNNRLAPEKKFQSLIERGDSASIRALKGILPEETFKKIKGAFLESTIKRDAEGSFTFKSFHNNLRTRKIALSEILDANEIEEISELIRLGDRFGNPVLSTSGTGASNVFGDIAKGIKSGAGSDLVIDRLKKSARAKAALKVEKVAQKTVDYTPSTMSKLAEKAPKIVAETSKVKRTVKLSDLAKADLPNNVIDIRSKFKGKPESTKTSGGFKEINLKDVSPEHHETVRQIHSRFKESGDEFAAAFNSVQGSDKLYNKTTFGNKTFPIPNFKAKPTGKMGKGFPSDSFDDPFPWMDHKYKVGKNLLKEHKKLGKPVEIHTASDLIAHTDYIKEIPKGSKVYMYMPPEMDLVKWVYETQPSQKRVIKAAERLQKAGVDVVLVKPDFDIVLRDAIKNKKNLGMTSEEIEPWLRKQFEKGVIDPRREHRDLLGAVGSPDKLAGVKVVESASSKGAATGTKEASKIPSSIAKTADDKMKQLASISPAAARLISSQKHSSESKTPQKGQKKWALEGFSRLFEKDKSGFLRIKSNVDKIFNSKKGMKLLISASSMKSEKALIKLLDQIKNEVE